MQPRTRSSQSLTHEHVPTREELAKLNQDVLSSEKQAWEFLERQGYAPTDVQGNQALLSYTLLLLAHCVPPSILPKGIRAVATLLEQEVAAQNTELIAIAIMRQISLLLDLSNHAAEIIDEATKHTQQAADRIYSTCEEARDEINKATENATNEISSAIENIKGDISKATEELHTATMQMETQCEKGTTKTGARITYTDTLNRQLPMTHAGTLARSQTCNRQILVDKTPDAPANHLDNLDEGSLVENSDEDDNTTWMTHHRSKSYWGQKTTKWWDCI